MDRESGALLDKCVAVDPHDYLALYYAALHYAHGETRNQRLLIGLFRTRIST